MDRTKKTHVTFCLQALPVQTRLGLVGHFQRGQSKLPSDVQHGVFPASEASTPDHPLQTALLLQQTVPML